MECHKILQRQDSYHTKVKALKYLEFTQDTIGHQKVMEKLSAPRVKNQTTGMMREAQNMHNKGCQSVLRDRHYDSIWFWRVGKWLHHMEKTYQEWLHEVDLSYHIISWVYGTHFYKRACNGVRKHHTTRPTHRHMPNGRVPLGG